MSSAMPPPGVWVPVPTFFVSRTSPKYAKGSPPLDLATQAKHSIFLAKAGIKGLLLLGSTGEAVSLTQAERKELVSHVRKALTEAGYTGYPLMAGTTAQGIEDVLSQLNDAKTAGADYGMCLTPGYFAGQATAEGTAAWFEAIADRSPLPVLIYHFPGVTNNIRIPIAAFERMAKHPNIVGCKLSHGDVSSAGQIALSPAIDHRTFYTFTGFGQQLLPILAVGGAGAIDALSGIFPHSVVAIYDLYRAPAENREGERWRIMHKLQHDVSRAEELVVRYGVVGVKTAASKILGLGDHDGTRLPLAGGMTDLQWEEFKQAFESLQAIEDRLSKGTDEAFKL